MGGHESECSNNEAQAANISFHFCDNKGTPQYVHHIDHRDDVDRSASTESPKEQTLSEEPSQTGNTANATTCGNQQNDDCDTLEFSSSNPTHSENHTRSGALASMTRDNLPLVLAEKQSMTFMKELQVAREEIGGLQVDLDRQRLRRDELETQVLKQEEQMLSQKGSLEQRIFELEKENAKLRETKSDGCYGEASTRKIVRNLEKAVKLLTEMCSADRVSETAKKEGNKIIEESLAMIRASTEADGEASTSLRNPFPDKTTTECFHQFLSHLAGVVDPAGIHGDVLMGVTENDTPLDRMIKAASTYVYLAQELADTQSVQLAELREELQVVRKDRNELIGQQSEQVRLLQEELLEKNKEELQLMERIEAMQVELETLKAGGHALNKHEAAELDFDRDEWERTWKAKYELEKREACAALEEKLHDQQLSADAAKRAQRNVFTERLTAVQEQLKNVRVVTDEERGKYENELKFLRSELDTMRAALEAKEVALGIALREDVRKSLQRDDGEDRKEATQRGATVSSFNPLYDAADDQQGDFEALKIVTDTRTHSLSLSSQGFSFGDHTTASRRANSSSISRRTPSDAGVRADNAAPARSSSSSSTSTGISSSLARLFATRSPDSFGNDEGSTRARSPSPIYAPPPHARNASNDLARGGSIESQLPSPPSSSSPLMADVLAFQQSEKDEPRPSRRKPSRLAPQPATPPLHLELDHSRRVTFVGVPPLAPSPATSSKTALSPVPAEAIDASPADNVVWTRDVSRSLSSSFGNSPVNTAFVQDTSGDSIANKENGSVRDLHASPLLPLEPSPRADIGTPPALSPPQPLPLRHCSESAANSVSTPASSGKKRRFVKMGSLQRMREVWAKQESLLLGSPALLDQGRSPPTQ